MGDEAAAAEAACVTNAVKWKKHREGSLQLHSVIRSVMRDMWIHSTGNDGLKYISSTIFIRNIIIITLTIIKLLSLSLRHQYRLVLIIIFHYYYYYYYYAFIIIIIIKVIISDNYHFNHITIIYK